MQQQRMAQAAALTLPKLKPQPVEVEVRKVELEPSDEEEDEEEPSEAEEEPDEEEIDEDEQKLETDHQEDEEPLYENITPCGCRVDPQPDLDQDMYETLQPPLQGQQMQQSSTLPKTWLPPPVQLQPCQHHHAPIHLHQNIPGEVSNLAIELLGGLPTTS